MRPVGSIKQLKVRGERPERSEGRERKSCAKKKEAAAVREPLSSVPWGRLQQWHLCRVGGLGEGVRPSLQEQPGRLDIGTHIAANSGYIVNPFEGAWTLRLVFIFVSISHTAPFIRTTTALLSTKSEAALKGLVLSCFPCRS